MTLKFYPNQDCTFFSWTNFAIAASMELLVWLMSNGKEADAPTMWPWPLTIPMALALNFFMMTSSNGNIFCITGHLCGEFTGPCLNKQLVNNREAGDLRCYWAHHDVILMLGVKVSNGLISGMRGSIHMEWLKVMWISNSWPRMWPFDDHGGSDWCTR